ncbi:50S ribosomal protein L6 [Candidatus Parcubacteria bacterium]|nr:MAG: 50S ribosomal protein L6 [Candidatus Parcubacteria bacterium]
MSRIGKLPINLPQGVTATIEENEIIVKGPKGELKQTIVEPAKIEITEQAIKVVVPNPEHRREKAVWGLMRSLINNMVIGVTEGFEKKLEINGVGYKAALQGNKLVLNVGFSHPVEYELPAGVSAQVEGKVITIGGIDKQLVGEVAAQIRRIKKPEPYKGKGIKYLDEVIIRKAGKTASKGE